MLPAPEIILAILLDPKGIEAVYPGKTCEDCAWTQCPEEEVHPFWEPYCDQVAHRILDSWLLSGAEAAIQTAYDLLPKS